MYFASPSSIDLNQLRWSNPSQMSSGMDGYRALRYRALRYIVPVGIWFVDCAICCSCSGNTSQVCVANGLPWIATGAGRRVNAYKVPTRSTVNVLIVLSTAFWQCFVWMHNVALVFVDIIEYGDRWKTQLGAYPCGCPTRAAVDE